MLNLQWVIKRPQLEKRSAWISIYLLINSKCAFVNFIVHSPSLIGDSLLWNSNGLHSAQTWHSVLALCFVENFMKQAWTHASMEYAAEILFCEGTESEEMDTHSCNEKRPSMVILWSHRKGEQDRSWAGDAVTDFIPVHPACLRQACQKYSSLCFPNLNRQGHRWWW